MAKNMNSPWQKHSSKQVYKNKWVEVVEDSVTMPNGNPGIYGVVHVRNGVFIIALTEDNTVYIEHQYRYPRQSWVWELPAGGVDDDNTPLQSAQTELREELGLRAEHWELIGTSDSSITGVTDDKIFVFVATGLSQVSGTTQLEEGIAEVKTVTIPELFALAQDGVIADSQSVASLMYFRLWLDKRQ